MLIGSRIDRYRWLLRRFGLTPQKIWYRLTNRTQPKLLCVSVPKAGTHLLERALCLHPRLYRKLVRTVHGRNIGKLGGIERLLAHLGHGQILVTHLRPAPQLLQAIEAGHIKCVFIIRDPRDIVVSRMFYVSKEEKHFAHAALAAQAAWSDRLRLAIEGYPPANFGSIAQILEGYAGWLDGGCLVVRFEDLIGPQGGGDKSRQLQALRAIYDHIGVEVSEGYIFALSKQVFSPSSPTFRKGTIGQWRQHFDEETKQTFKRLAGKWLIHYRYEEDDQW